MDYIVIGGKKYECIVAGLTENFDILNGSNAGRTIAEGAPMVLDPLGTFYYYNITFMNKEGYEKEYDELFDFVSIPRRDGVPVKLVHGQKTQEFEAYISTGERALKRITRDGRVYWDAMTIKITPMKAQVIPE